MQKGSRGSNCFEATVESNVLKASPSERDEIKEIRKNSAVDTAAVRLWRLVTNCVLLCTALIVTLATYKLLKGEERKDFETAFSQFSETVKSAVIRTLQNVYVGNQALGDMSSVVGDSMEQDWPFVTIPKFEFHGRNALSVSRMEITSIFPKVKRSDRDAWLDFADRNYKAVYNESHTINPSFEMYYTGDGYQNVMKRKTKDGFVTDDDHETYYPLWQTTPPALDYKLLNWNCASVPNYKGMIDAVEILREPLLTKVRRYAALGDEAHDRLHSKKSGSSNEHPHTFIMQPVFRVPGDKKSEVVAVWLGAFAWDVGMRNMLASGVRGIHCVVRNNCNQTFTYEIDGPDAFFLGNEDHHDPKYDDMEVYSNMDSADHHSLFKSTPGHCSYEMVSKSVTHGLLSSHTVSTQSIYPSDKFAANYDSNTPENYAIVFASTFAAIAIVYFIYDSFVQRRNNKMILNAARSNAIVSSVFPGNIRDRLIQASRGYSDLGAFVKKESPVGAVDEITYTSKPLADFIPNTTVMFADIVGFTAWSSVREPSHVFTLLETVYSAFDAIAKEYSIFKVETVGDCYVAAAGIAYPRNDHGIAIVNFAALITRKMRHLCQRLDVHLGPDTGDLALRVGVHSGPVTAGVLRGERARFRKSPKNLINPFSHVLIKELFGDTMNVTARVEAGGSSDRIHISQETADIVSKAGMSFILTKRTKTIPAKGKGPIQTYWVDDSYVDHVWRTACSEESTNFDETEQTPSQMPERLIDWNLKVLESLLRKIAALRKVQRNTPSDKTMTEDVPACFPAYNCVLEEVKEIIRLPKFNANAAKRQYNPDEIELTIAVRSQLRDYVGFVAGMYRSNAFHNFEHASHVTMSVIKLLSRIVAPSGVLDNTNGAEDAAATLHDHTYGITSDPLTQFACAFAALIHDVDHTGVPNATLIKENAEIAARYMNRSVAEQNSFALCWEMIMEERYKDLRGAIFQDSTELDRFRQLVVNGVMATDIVDKELKNLRNSRWDKAFTDADAMDGNSYESVNRKATVVIEHLIQASDVAHTMQHWHVYRKWNELYFRECYQAYLDGRADSNPLDTWYEDELGFFDYYIIPLAKKLKNCGVFGVSSDEYLNYALQNRAEWESRGPDVIASMVQNLKDSPIEEAIGRGVQL